MNAIDLFYLDQHLVPVHSEHVQLEELFLRKLVDATMVRNQLWEHERNESNGDSQSAIHVIKWNAAEWEEVGPAIEKVIYGAFDVSPYYEVQRHLWISGEYSSLARKQSKDAWQAAVDLLDHQFTADSRLYEVQYSILDLDRRKLHIFLREEK